VTRRGIAPPDGDEHQAGHLPAHLLDGLADARQGRIGGQGDGRVVEADDRDVVGHPPAGGPQRGQRAGRHQIRRREHRVQIRPLGEEVTHQAGAGLVREVAGRDQLRIVGQAGSREGILIAPQTVDSGVHVGRSGDRGDPPPAEGREVLHRRPRAIAVVDIDEADSGPRGPAPDHQRQSALGQALRQGIVAVERGEQGAVDVTSREVALQAFLVARAFGHQQHELELRRGELRADAAEQAREERVIEQAGRRLRDDHADRVAAARHEAARGGVGDVTQAADRLLDGPPDIRADLGRSVDHPRHRGTRHARLTGDGFQRRTRPAVGRCGVRQRGPSRSSVCAL
jgi:hypothetical protein